MLAFLEVIVFERVVPSGWGPKVFLEKGPLVADDISGLVNPVFWPLLRYEVLGLLAWMHDCLH